jgi:UDP-N-acetylmuramate dehydrogenase
VKIDQSKILENEPLARYTAWKIGGPARYFAAATSAEEFAALLHWAQHESLPVFILGGGSNILIADGGFPGLVIRNRAAQQRIEDHGDEATLWIESGAPTAGTARRLVAQGYGGLVWAEGLPGTIGGALYGNAGCYGGDMAHALIRASVLRDGEIEEWPVERFAYDYRSSALKRAHGSTGAWEHGSAESPRLPSPPAPTRSMPPCILAAEIRLFRDDPARLTEEMRVIAEARKGKTPSGSSCGSVFKNPPGTTAGTLLDRAGIKGTRVGGAVVSEKHANYIVNTGGATAGDVLRLSGIMRERVLREFGVELEFEVQVVGEQP